MNARSCPALLNPILPSLTRSYQIRRIPIRWTPSLQTLIRSYPIHLTLNPRSLTRSYPIHLTLTPPSLTRSYPIRQNPSLRNQIHWNQTQSSPRR